MYSVFTLSDGSQHTLVTARRAMTRNKTDAKRHRPRLPLGYILREKVSMVDGVFRSSLPKLSLELMRMGEA